MACKGYKHPTDCKCNFPHGNPHPEDNLPRRRATSFTTFSAKIVRHFEPKLKICRHCGELVYHKTFSSGQTGTFVFGRANLRHKCPAAPYDPFTRQNRPRLRQILEQYQKEGWTPLFETEVENDMFGAWLKGVSFSTPTERKFKLPNKHEIDLNELIYFRFDEERGITFLRFFDLKEQTFVEIFSEE